MMDNHDLDRLCNGIADLLGGLPLYELFDDPARGDSRLQKRAAAMALAAEDTAAGMTSIDFLKAMERSGFYSAYDFDISPGLFVVVMRRDADDAYLMARISDGRLEGASLTVGFRFLRQMAVPMTRGWKVAWGRGPVGEVTLQGPLMLRSRLRLFLSKTGPATEWNSGCKSERDFAGKLATSWPFFSKSDCAVIEQRYGVAGFGRSTDGPPVR
jgi:hypothetical protein